MLIVFQFKHLKLFSVCHLNYIEVAHITAMFQGVVRPNLPPNISKLDKMTQARPWSRLEKITCNYELCKYD